MQSQALQEMNGGPSPPFFIFMKFTVEKLPQAEAEIKYEELISKSVTSVLEPST